MRSRVRNNGFSTASNLPDQGTPQSNAAVSPLPERSRRPSAEADRSHFVAMSDETPPFTPGRCVPEADAAVAVPRDQEPAIRRERDANTQPARGSDSPTCTPLLTSQSRSV